MASDMQNEAMERLRQMYQGAKPIAESKKPTVTSTKNEESKIQPIDKKPVPNGIFDALFQDKEKSLILILIIILLSEKADESIILALIYLIL